MPVKGDLFMYLCEVKIYLITLKYNGRGRNMIPPFCKIKFTFTIDIERKKENKRGQEMRFLLIFFTNCFLLLKKAEI